MWVHKQRSSLSCIYFYLGVIKQILSREWRLFFPHWKIWKSTLHLGFFPLEVLRFYSLSEKLLVLHKLLIGLVSNINLILLVNIEIIVIAESFYKLMTLLLIYLFHRIFTLNFDLIQTIILRIFQLGFIILFNEIRINRVLIAWNLHHSLFAKCSAFQRIVLRKKFIILLKRVFYFSCYIVLALNRVIIFWTCIPQFFLFIHNSLLSFHEIFNVQLFEINELVISFSC